MERTPFSPLTEFKSVSQGLFCINREAISNPNVLVKEVRQLMRYPNQPHLDEHYDFDFFKKDVVDPINTLTTDASPVAKFIPPVFCVWGENDSGEPKGFIVMRRVYGDDIQDISSIGINLAASLDIVIARTFDIESENPRYRLSVDIVQIDVIKPGRFHNIVVGMIGNEEVQPYLVDLYPTRGYKLPFNSKRARMKRIKWEEAMADLISRSNGYTYPHAQAKFEEYIADYEVRGRGITAASLGLF